MVGPYLRCAVALLTAVAAEAIARGHARVSPDVESSDKKFFDKDFAYDKRPEAGRHYKFDHPYPAVQDTSDFDRDFVKDENNDGGKWQAQMDYDALRTKIRRAEKKLAEAKAKLEQEEADWKSAQSTYSRTQKDANSAEETRKKAELESNAAQKKVDALEGQGKGGTQVGGEVGEAVRKVNDEMEDLENCKKELAAAKKRLKELIKEKEDLDKKEKDDEVVRVKEVEKEKKVKTEEKGRKDVERDAAEKEEKVQTAEESQWKSKLEKEKQDHSEATKSYDEELADVKRTEAQLKVAEKNLRKYRRSPYVDGNGGVYNDPDHSGARHSLVAVGAVVAMIAAAAM